MRCISEPYYGESDSTGHAKSHAQIASKVREWKVSRVQHEGCTKV